MQPTGFGRLMRDETIFATPREVTKVEDCNFYHTIDIPGYGLIEAEWDLRAGVDKYLGGVDLKGKRVLEVGTANGFLCFQMEQRGAEVVAYDLGENDRWDAVPYAGFDAEKFMAERRGGQRRMNNGFWLAHRAFGSKARMVNGTVYAMPEAMGRFDVATFGSILLHLRDPFLALWNALRLTEETAIVTDLIFKRHMRVQMMSRKPVQIFLPQAERQEPKDTWWALSPALVKQYLGTLGFEKTQTTYHTQFINGRKQLLFTIVGRRTKGSPVI